MYFDKNNLYGESISQPLPERDFAWLTPEQLQSLDVKNVPDNAETGYILEVDLDYPEHLHESHNDYPLAPEILTVTKDRLSSYSNELREKLGIKGKSSKKLVPNLYHKKNYVLHYRNLKYYLAHGLILTKIHRAIEFTQSTWLKPYIDFNTKKSKEAKNDFEKDFFKLMNNSVFGKCMENMRKRVNVELVTTKRRLKKLTSKPNFQSFKIFNEDLVGVHLKRINITMNRPIYAGFCILDLSKISMYQFHYDFMKIKYGNKAILMYTDTDSTIFEVETENIYQDMHDHAHEFDTSNYPKDHFLYNPKNAKVLGKMKDECAGNHVHEFIGLRPKMYSVLYDKNSVLSQKCTAKGIKKCVIDQQFKHDLYKECLFKESALKHSMNLIRSYNHQLYSVSCSKTSLSPYDDKRYILESGIDTLAHGHKDIDYV